jgi:beta-1,4-mannosyltransferase
MKVLFFWEAVGGLTLEHRCNPYAGLLARELEKRDIHLELGDYDFERDWLERKRPDFEVLHLNWLDRFYRAEDLEATLERYTRFAENVGFARSLGYRIVWTLHNFYPHERPFPALDRLARHLVCSQADAVIAHCEYAAGLVRKVFFRRENLHVIPHGNFIDAFPNQISREDARRQLEIPEQAFVYLFFGNARAYKSIETLIEAFGSTAAQDAQLVLMMRQAFSPEYADELRALAKRDERIRVFTSTYFANADFQLYINSADVAVLPFSEVLTSGSAITALSFGLPVVLPRLGCLPELIDARMGLLYDPREKKGLEKALVEIRGQDLKAAGRAALERARELDWEGIAGRIARLYRGDE